MRHIYLPALVVVFATLSFQTLSAQNWAFQPSLRRLIEAPVSEIYIPSGFDDNDKPQVIVSGEFENGCTEVKGIQLTKHEIKTPDLEKTWFKFFVEAWQTPDIDCPKEKREEKNVAYVEVLSLPVLKEGLYEIWNAQLKKNDPAGYLSISKAPEETKHEGDVSKDESARDTFDYANLKSARLQADELNEGTYLLTMKGFFSNTCHEINADQSQFIQKTKHVIEVLPVIFKYKDEGCEKKDIEFERPLRVPVKLDKTNYLFHIRIRGGKAINLKVNMKDLKKQIIHHDPEQEHKKTDENQDEHSHKPETLAPGR